MDRKIKYIGYYDLLYDGKQKRLFSLAAAKKMDYLCDVLNKLQYSVEIVSPSYITGKSGAYTAASHQYIHKGVELTLTPSCGARNKIVRIFRVLLAKLWLFVYLIKHCRKNEKILVYHNYELSLPILLAQKIKKFNILLEIEEQYSMVWKLTRFQKRKENMLLKAGGDQCLVVSESLCDKLGIKKGIISYGNYRVYSGEIAPKGNNNTILLIYTGSIDKVKGSAFIAAETMRYLPNNYYLILTGNITKSDERDFFRVINNINREYGSRAEYKGVLNDSEYQRLLLSADIALNPQKEGEFGSYLFPSKILTYLTHALPVVSTRGESIVKSQVAEYITFSDKFTAESMAQAILTVDFEKSKNVRQKLKQMNGNFVAQIGELIK
ncbi:glycosyltransferase [Sporolactobacillus sp. CQH2019]|uniref:glycosyltransferase n=1 Tax=Sporolactobacillus sp. CQH2019 TaxID=3023512 RepID=UPI00236744EC|nr:glycosyltransferase [Sporolactobacillus sp. CQH2019]MDD9148845.1 glycosyltransferase [Sporolactobacillus sp. CQH2019]